jgi:hypothetical protein
MFVLYQHGALQLDGIRSGSSLSPASPTAPLRQIIADGVSAALLHFNIEGFFFRPLSSSITKEPG